MPEMNYPPTSRSTQITQLFSKRKSVPENDRKNATSQRYSQGNVAIFAQVIASIRKVLPPLCSEINEAMCALFISAETVTIEDNIRKLGPVLISKTWVEKMIKFLLAENVFYSSAEITFSPENMVDLLGEGNTRADVGVPCAVELCCLPDEHAVPAEGYADRGGNERPHDVRDLDPDTVVMEAVGYRVGERTPQDYRKMKVLAVVWCLDKKNYIWMQSDCKFISDRDPGLLTFTFPQLDPWGIGGFHEPNRTEAQEISFERQKKEVNRHVSFRTDATVHATIVEDIQKIGPSLTDLIKKWELNPNVKPSNQVEKKAMCTLGKLKILAKDLKGSLGYKQCRWNKIRAMMKWMATPALFLTINPADIMDPLLGAIGGIDPAVWSAMTDFDQRMFEWLESLIRCELPSDTKAVIETNGALKAPPLARGKQDPQLTKGLHIDSLSEVEFEAAFRETVEDLVIKSNWHDHRDTCWKYLKNREPRNDQSCHMRIDGTINPFTHVDPKTESIMLRRLHPRINHYNDLIMFLLRCNMDIKHIGSGDTAKALVYYSLGG
ncbi:hypothetical protein B0H10DRAFT_1964367 [Mycena sp. CBHHK59/15]|nr:hypothetical protein B0H10DRAFT_1964367 [Mycena sp. CBHHK59/15]